MRRSCFSPAPIIGYNELQPPRVHDYSQMAEPTGKVLIVDDDRFVRMALNEAVRSWGYDVVEAENVSGAKKAFDEEEPAIALLDIDLPDGSGLDVLKFIKEK